LAIGAASFDLQQGGISNDTTKMPRPTRIDIHAEHELRYWSERFGVPKDEIEAAVKRVGPRVEDVAREVSLLYA
jgi:Protein of unknown function (DUF3606)